MERLIQDIRYAARVLMKGRAVTVVAVFALALGIGANTAIFSVVNSVLLRPLPYAEPEQLVMLWENNPEIEIGFDLLPVAIANFVDWRDQSESFEHVSILDSSPQTLTGGEAPERVAGANVSANFFQLMGVSPAFGRAFTQEEDRPGANTVAVISHAMWQSRFGGHEDVLDKTLILEGKTYRVIGVMPEGFSFPRAQDLPSYFRLAPRTDVWTPIGLTDEQLNNRGSHNKAVIARLKENVSVAAAQAEMNQIAARIGERYPEASGFGVTVLSLHEHLVGGSRTALWILLGAVAFVLLIACANVANLLLARAASRQKEIAIRTALGAGRGRIIRQLLTESVLLALLGGLAGALIALWGLDLILAFSPDSIPRKDEIGIDGRVLGFTFLASLATGLLFGLVPAYYASKLNLNETLKEGARGTSRGVLTRSARKALVVFEVAVTVVLLVGAGLLLRSFAGLIETDPGFSTRGILSMDVFLSDSKYPKQSQQIAFFKDVLDRINNLPGIESASAVSDLPLSGAEEIDQFTPEGRPQPANYNDTPLADFRFADHRYFSLLRIPLVQGRYFTAEDDEKSQNVVIISEEFARRFYPGEDPVGKRLKPGDFESRAPWCSIVGVVRDVKHSGLDSNARPHLYFPYTQKSWGNLTLVARATSDPRSVFSGMREAVWAVDKDQPVSNLKTMDELFSASVSHRRFNLILLGLFAGAALLLAAVGLYGVMSYSVTERTHEIGIRQALGARGSDVLGMVARQGMALAGAGLLIGIAAAFALTRWMSSLLYEVSATDPLTFALVPLLIAGVALGAILVPALRATRVDPMVALRHE
ncbi:MAG TPA: ABC transporter permease [Blastocatellia bacterium]|jgi:putative ABC transport system permease protein